MDPDDLSEQGLDPASAAEPSERGDCWGGWPVSTTDTTPEWIAAARPLRSHPRIHLTGDKTLRPAKDRSGCEPERSWWRVMGAVARLSAVCTAATSSFMVTSASLAPVRSRRVLGFPAPESAQVHRMELPPRARPVFKG